MSDCVSGSGSGSMNRSVGGLVSSSLAEISGMVQVDLVEQGLFV